MPASSAGSVPPAAAPYAHLPHASGTSRTSRTSRAARTHRTYRTTGLSRLRRRAVTVAALAGSAVVLAAVPAFAHVTVQPNTAPKGSYSTVNFKVPDEEDHAKTVRIEVNLPADHPIASVSLQPVPGWTAQVTTVKLATPLKTDDGTVSEAVSKITWSGGKIQPGQFQQFPVSFGPLPDNTDTLTFKTLQTYDNGDIVRWIDIPQAGQPEPDHPAPALTLTVAPASGSGSGSATGSTPTGTPAAAPASDPKAGTAANANAPIPGEGNDDTARALGVAGIVLGIAGVAFGVFAGRRRNPAGDSPSGPAGGSPGASA
ncbi:YcnI family protein [Streptomyces sp. KK5PA1]|uniref:YcnI family protein n=2 Tax=Actinacidiphila acididurans TaxID=2784346 RepID=A0ABS2TSG5_9ACTN|nr:YcnI family protein [Actinacidiphila acididurans]